jgi:hypothetical protein
MSEQWTTSPCSAIPAKGPGRDISASASQSGSAGSIIVAVAFGLDASDHLANVGSASHGLIP